MHLLPEFVELHQHLKTAGLNHSLHFVVPFTLQSEAQDAKVALDGYFESITVNTIDTEPQGGWPFAPNMHFWACAQLMFRQNPGIPWQLVELDCRPIRANAYDVIAGKYASCGAPFFGFIGKTPWRTDQGKLTKSLWGDGDVMMSGCAVYPGNMIERPECAGLMADFMKGQESIEAPWDMHLRFAMKAEGMAHTELIANHWNTENYRIVNGRLRGDSRKEHEIFEQHPDWERRECGGYVHDDAVMVHGCKDDSLFKLVISGDIHETLFVINRKPEPVPTPAVTIAGPEHMPATVAMASAADARLDRLENMMMTLMQETRYKQPAGVPQPPPPQPPTGTLLEQVISLVPANKAARIGDIAQKTGSDIATIRSVVDSSGTLIFTPPGWVKHKAA